MIPLRTGLRWFPLGLLISSLLPCRADITLDGSMGPAGALAGPDFQIGAELGHQVGSNLFHSFGVFNINSPESATFSGPNSIDNILGRVTGGSASTINGLLRSTIPEANLFFLNPAGVVFGPNATLDVQGSFHVSAADYLKLADGTRFDVLPSSNDALLTTAPPEAFGFLGENPAGISVQGSFLQVPDGKTLSVVGGDIKVADGSLYAPGGRIDMASVASPGEVLPNAPDLGVASFARLGKIEVSHASSESPVFDGNEIGNVDASGEGGGRIFIRSGEFVADNAFIFADTRGDGEGQGIDMGVTGRVTMRNGAEIIANTLGSGSGGDLTVKAGSLEVRNGARISACNSGPGNQCGNASISGAGQGGNVTVTADRMFLSGDGANFEGILLPTGIFAQAWGGSAGDVAVTTGNLEVRNGAVISASTLDGGPGGNVTVTAADITLQNGGSISAESTSTGLDLEADPDAGRSGTVFITATDSLRLLNGGQVSVETAQANAGDIILNVGTLLHLRDQSSIMTSVAGGAGDGGNITIDPVFTVLDGDSKIVAQAREGSGGTILIDSDFFFKSPDSLVDASSGNPALSGTVEIDSPDTDITGGVTALPESFFDAATLLTTPCAERSGAEVSRLVIRRYEVLPDSPYALRVQLPKAVLGATDRAADERDIPSMRVHPSLAFTCPDDG